MPRATKGTGSISHDPKNNRYHGQITISGKRYKVYGKTKTETRTKLNAIIAAGGKPTPASHTATATGDTGQTVAELVEEWQAKDLASRDRSPAPWPESDSTPNTSPNGSELSRLLNSPLAKSKRCSRVWPAKASPVSLARKR